VDNPNTGTWDYLYKIGVFSASANAPASFTLNYGGSGTVTPSGSSVPTGRFKVEGRPDDSLTFSLTDLPNGEYQLDVQVFSKKGEVRLETFADEYFALVSSDLNVFLSLFDPEQELDLSTMSLQAYAVTSISTSLEGSQILSIAASSMVSVTGEDGAHYQFSLQNPYDFANALGGAEVSSGIHEIGGLLVRLFDHAAKNADQAVRLSEFREDVPTDGDWYIDLIKRGGDVEIEGTFLAPGDFFSFEKDEVFVEFEDDNGVERQDIDLLVENEEETDTATGESINEPYFFAGDGRRIIEISPFGENSSGEALEPDEFFDRSLSSGGNISFDEDLFNDSITGQIFPGEGDLYLVEFPRRDGTLNYALMIITYQDEYGFALRYAKATRTIPEISFGGGVIKDRIRLSMDFESGGFFAEGGVPGTEFFLLTSSNKGYTVSGTGQGGFDQASCSGSDTSTTPYEFTETCIGSFDTTGEIDGYVEFLEDFFPTEGDVIEIVGYSYTDPSGEERSVDLPNPLRFFFREDKFGGFGLAYTTVVTAGEFHVAYFGEPNMETATNSSNYLIKTSDAFDGWLFKGMGAGAHGGVNIVSIEPNPTPSPQMGLSGVLKFVLDAPYLDSADKYLAVSATGAVWGTNGESVERKRHVVTLKTPYGTLVNPPDPDTRWLEVREDDYGFRSEPFLKKATDIGGIRFEEGNPFGNFEDFREFLAWNYDNGLQHMGIGNFDSFDGQRKFWEIPQTTENYDPFDNSAPRADVFFASNSTKVGDTLTGTYRMGNSFHGTAAAGEFGDDYRPRVRYWATLLRAMPMLGRDGIQFGRAMEVRVVQHVQWPLYDENGVTEDFDENNFEERTFRFWFADTLGTVRTEQEQRFINSDQGDFINHGYRAKSKVVAYKRSGEDPFVAEGDPRLLFDDDSQFTGFDTVDVKVELGFGEEGSNYKLVVLRPTRGIEGHVVDSAISAQLDDPENFENRLPDRFASVEFSTTPTSEGHFIFQVYKYQQGDNVASDVEELDSNLVGEVPFHIDGDQGFTHVFIELRKEGETPAIMLFEGSGFSFLAGEFTGSDEPKRDFSYQRQDFGNGVEMRLNKFLPDGDTLSGRRIKEVLLKVVIWKNDLKEF
jgi:hypothetical protein